MKKILFILTVFLVILGLSSCELLTFHPIFTSKELVFDARLLGTWKNEKSGDIHIAKATPAQLKDLSPEIRASADKIYILTKNIAHETDEMFYAFLVRLGDNLYFDTYPVNLNKRTKVAGFFESHYVRMHAISRVKIENNSKIQLLQFEGNYLEKLIDQKTIRIRHEVISDGNIFVTASTSELQQYILKYGDQPEAYDSPEGTTYTRTIQH